MSKRYFHLFVPVLVFMLFTHCAELQQFSPVQKPVVKLANTRITGLSLNTIDLIFDLDIENPNPLSIRTAGLDYDFQLNHASLVKGNQNDEMLIQSNGKSRVAIPLSLNFQDIYQAYQSLKNQDSTEYALKCGVIFDLPLLGPTRIPVQKSGHLPLIKIPNIQIHKLKLNRLTLTRAELMLELKMKNPNAFQLRLNNLNYQFNVNGLSWSKGNITTPVSVKSKSENTIRIPISLSFIEIGQTVYQLISGNKKLDYQLSGQLGFDTSLQMLKNGHLPISKTGSVHITK